LGREADLNVTEDAVVVVVSTSLSVVGFAVVGGSVVVVGLGVAFVVVVGGAAVVLGFLGVLGIFIFSTDKTITYKHTHTHIFNIVIHNMTNTNTYQV